jgi:hypothetical protein
MPVKRRALIIEASKAKNQAVINGAAEDARRLRVWLNHNNGGGWNDDEIETLSNPSMAQVTAALTRARADYTWVSFSGHGYIEEDSRTGRRTQKVIIGTGEEIPFTSLRPVSDKCTLVCDACRIVEETAYFSERVAKAMIYKRSHDKYSRSTYRNWFDVAIDRANSGAFFMYGCSAGQFSYEDPLVGGYFTAALIEGAANWSDSVEASGWLSMQAAIDEAAAKVTLRTANKKPPQNPTGGPENRSGNSFPFAVAIT